MYEKYDNSGGGDCFYKAAAISLMVCLRTRNMKTRHDIFSRLNMNENLQEELLTILNLPLTEMLQGGNKRKIESQLGLILRQQAAAHTVQNISLATPEQTTEGCEISHIIRKELGLSQGGQDYSSAEILKMPNLINGFITPIVRQYKDAVQAIHSDNFITKDEKTKRIDHLIETIVIKEVLKNKDWINEYCAFLTRPGRWAASEEIRPLQNVINGNVPYDENNPEYIRITCFYNGKAQYPESNRHGIILNCTNNIHWTSFISKRYSLTDTTWLAHQEHAIDSYCEEVEKQRENISALTYLEIDKIDTQNKKIQEERKRKIKNNASTLVKLMLLEAEKEAILRAVARQNSGDKSNGIQENLPVCDNIQTLSKILERVNIINDDGTSSENKIEAIDEIINLSKELENKTAYRKPLKTFLLALNAFVLTAAITAAIVCLAPVSIPALATTIGISVLGTKLGVIGGASIATSVVAGTVGFFACHPNLGKKTYQLTKDIKDYADYEKHEIELQP